LLGLFITRYQYYCLWIWEGIQLWRTNPFDYCCSSNFTHSIFL